MRERGKEDVEGRCGRKRERKVIYLGREEGRKIWKETGEGRDKEIGKGERGKKDMERKGRRKE